MWLRSVFRVVSSPSRAQWLVGLLVAVAVGGVALYVTRQQGATPSPGQSSVSDSLRSEIQSILPADAIFLSPLFAAATLAFLEGQPG